MSATSKLFPEFLQKEKKVLEYMDSSVRTSNDDKATVHKVNSTLENTTNSDLLNLLKKMKEG